MVHHCGFSLYKAFAIALDEQALSPAWMHLSKRKAHKQALISQFQSIY
jgi:hypothetical protein